MASPYYEGSGASPGKIVSPERGVGLHLRPEAPNPRKIFHWLYYKSANVFYININILSDVNFENLKINKKCLISTNSVDLYIARPARFDVGLAPTVDLVVITGVCRIFDWRGQLGGQSKVTACLKFVCPF